MVSSETTPVGEAFEPGDVEAGLYVTFEQLGIEEPRTAAEKMAVYVARRLDNAREDAVIAALSREYRQWLEEVKTQDKPTPSGVDALINRQ